LPIEHYEISDTQVGPILSYVEGHFLDLKAKEIKPSKLTKAISAFANADGGELYIGIAESGQIDIPHTWEGFADPEDANAHLQVFENLFPLSGDYRYNFLSNPNQTGYVLQVNIRKTRNIVRANDDLPYIRRGAQSLPVDTPEKLRILEHNKGIVSFEDQPVSVELGKVCNSETAIRFILEVVPTIEPEDFLRKQELLKDQRPTVAAVVLFADLPQAVLPKRTGIVVYRYKTAAVEGTRDTLAGQPVSVEGCAYDSIKEAVRLTQEIIGGIQVLGPKGFEPVNYPTETLHEVITNAVLHRDYSIADDVHVRIFDNRVEVESPGRLPAHITKDNILRERFSRNGHIVNVINKFPDPPNKNVGEGLNTAFEAMRNLRLKDPLVIELENSVVVQIKHEKLASIDSIIMEYLDNNDMITNQTARSLTGVKSENSMKGTLNKLRKKGMIEPVPDRSGFKSAWRKTQANNDNEPV
jgi:ATP-dependent DNA helicase RecG